MKKIYSWIIFFLLILLCALKSNAQCISTGSKNGSLFTNVSSSGLGTWSNPANIATSNTIPSSLATTVPAGDVENSNFIYVQNFGFNIPANAIVCGVTVKIERKQQGADNINTFVKDNSVQLLKNSVIDGNNRAFPWNWNNFYSNVVHGSTSDTWGTTLTAADINSPNFGVAINVMMQSNCCDQTMSADIDHVSLTVFYTVPLPVELVNIEISSPNNRVVKMEWTSLSENNNAGFSIERSKDAINWKEVEFIEGAGTSNSSRNYSITDEQPYQGVSYYRIKQIDLNGNSQYYDPKSITISNEILVKPMGETVGISSLDGSEVKITLLDFSGRSINYNSKSTDNDLLIETNSLIPGIYIIIIETPAQKKILKFLI
jgi:hypothetical protein